VTGLEPREAGSPGFTIAGIAAGLARVEGLPVEIVQVASMARASAATELKHMGYGDPLLVRYRLAGAVEERRAVLHTMAPNWFGHDRRADRAGLVLLAADTYPTVLRHSRVLDVGAVDARGELLSLAGAGELYLLTTYVEGTLYAHDLRRIEADRRSTPADVDRARALASYLVDLHRTRIPGPKELYHRAVRDLVGSGEGLFGIADSYPDEGSIPRARLTAIEHRAVEWRARLRARAHRLARTHGDFHPYNLLFREGVDFTVLDASRGALGDPADDLAALTINYVFGAVISPGAWAGGIAPLWRAFWADYLAGSGDVEALEIIAPFFAWRALVVASPVWYPALSDEQRSALLLFAERVLDARAFDPRDTSAFAPEASGR
jgi:hypothetical protein